jgi:hypothetical protein
LTWPLTNAIASSARVQMSLGLSTHHLPFDYLNSAVLPTLQEQGLDDSCLSRQLDGLGIAASRVLGANPPIGYFDPSGGIALLNCSLQQKSGPKAARLPSPSFRTGRPSPRNMAGFRSSNTPLKSGPKASFHHPTMCNAPVVSTMIGCINYVKSRARFGERANKKGGRSRPFLQRSRT